MTFRLTSRPAPRTERDYLVAAIARNEARRAALAERALWRGTCPCCIGASYGGTAGVYDRLGAKLERQRAWLEVLDARRARG